MIASGSRVLIADDEPAIRFALRETLEELGCTVVDVADGESAFEELVSGKYALVFLDDQMPGLSGLEVLDRAEYLDLETAVVIFITRDTYVNAVEAMKRGALDYLVKPLVLEQVLVLAIKALRTHKLEHEVRQLHCGVSRRTAPAENLVGKSPAMLEVFKAIGRVAPRDFPVLITGESGTGKERVARAIHAASPRSERPFVAVNTAMLPRKLRATGRAGHERGAFINALAPRIGLFHGAAGGTLFLDEIGDLSSDLQAHFLRVLQSDQMTPIGVSRAQAIDVRILTATHHNLDAAVRAGHVREDLFDRLRVVSMHVPPLRERREDVRTLAEHFVSWYSIELAGAPRALAAETLSLLCRHSWPGNVRELESAVKRALMRSSSLVLTPDDFAFVGEPNSPHQTTGTRPFAELVRHQAESELNNDAGLIYHQMLERVERPLIEAALARTGGNQVRAAALLGINRNTLRRKIADLAIVLRSE